jgi:hypothetical protein
METFFPLEIYTSRKLSNDDLIKAFSKLFSLSSDQIMITQFIDYSPNINNISDKKVKLLCNKDSELDGDLKEYLWVDTRDQNILSSIQNMDAKIKFISNFCHLLSCSCMITNDEEEPDDWYQNIRLFVSDEGEISEVYLDDEKIELGLLYIEKF